MIEKDDIPDRWDIVSLEDVVEYHSNLITPEDDETYNLVELDDIQRDAGSIINVQKKKGSNIGSNKREFTDQHILYCKLRPYLNKVAKPDFSGIATSELLILEPRDDVTYEYLYQFLSSPMVRDQAEFLMKGANQPRISKRELLDFNIPVPPLDEQERIVEVVEERLERVERLKKSVEDVGRLTKEYRDSLTEYLFTGRESLSTPSPNQIPAEDDIPNHWNIKTIGEISSQIRTGGTPKKSRGDFWGGDIPWKASKQFNENSLQLSESSEYVTDKGKSESTMANPDDVVIVCRGAHTGKVGLVKSEFLFNQDVKVIRLPESVNAEFVARYLSNHMEYFLQKQRGGTTKGITTSHVKNLRIPIPPAEEQKNIVHKVKSIDFGRVFKAVSDVDTHFEEYRDSVLAHAFDGQIDY